VATQLEQIDESQSFFGCLLYLLLLLLSFLFFVVVVVVILFVSTGGTTEIWSRQKSKKESRKKKIGKSRQPKLHIRERSDNIRTRKVKDSTIKIVRSEMMEEAKELFFFLLLLPRLYL
jgi:hypothetical protein